MICVIIIMYIVRHYDYALIYSKYILQNMGVTVEKYSHIRR